MARYENVLDTIGNTPLVDISELSPNPRVRVFIKLEGLNPAGSVKDRAAKSMIEEAEKNGNLHPGQRILESSSGNTAAGLAMIAKVKGYPFTVVVPENVSPERVQLLGVLAPRSSIRPQLKVPMAPCAARRYWPKNIRIGGFLTNMATRPTQKPITRAPGRRFGETARRSPISWPASVRRAQLSGWGPF